MAFDGEAFVDEMRAELQASGRTLDQADWVKRTEQGEATKEELVGWARQHYHGVTFHTRRILSAWVTRIPYEMTEGVIDNIAEEVLGTTSKSGFGHLPPGGVLVMCTDGILERRDEHVPRVLDRRRRHHLEAGNVRVPAFQAVGMLRGELAARAGRHADHERHVELTAGHVQQRRRVVHDLVEREEAEVDRHEFDHGPQPGHGRADTSADEERLHQLRDQQRAAARHALGLPGLGGHRDRRLRPRYGSDCGRVYGQRRH